MDSIRSPRFASMSNSLATWPHWFAVFVSAFEARGFETLWPFCWGYFFAAAAAIAVRHNNLLQPTYTLTGEILARPVAIRLPVPKSSHIFHFQNKCWLEWLAGWLKNQSGAEWKSGSGYSIGIRSIQADWNRENKSLALAWACWIQLGPHVSLAESADSLVLGSRSILFYRLLRTLQLNLCILSSSSIWPH